MTDPHLVRKIETATSQAELDGIRDAFKARGEQMPGEGVEALARRRAELAREGRT